MVLPKPSLYTRDKETSRQRAVKEHPEHSSYSHSYSIQPTHGAGNIQGLGSCSGPPASLCRSTTASRLEDLLGISQASVLNRQVCALWESALGIPLPAKRCCPSTWVLWTGPGKTRRSVWKRCQLGSTTADPDNTLPDLFSLEGTIQHPETPLLCLD